MAWWKRRTALRRRALGREAFPVIGTNRPRTLVRLALGLALLATAGGCSNTNGGGQAGPQPTVGPSAPATPSPTGTPAPTGQPVHVRLYQGDGSTWGVGMPIIAYFSKVVTDGRPFS